MPIKKIQVVILFVNLVFIIICAINIMELVEILICREPYPFGAEFFGPYSIYKSQQIYVTFKFVFTTIIIAMLVFSASRFRIMFWLLAFFIKVS